MTTIVIIREIFNDLKNVHRSYKIQVQIYVYFTEIAKIFNHNDRFIAIFHNTVFS